MKIYLLTEDAPFDMVKFKLPCSISISRLGAKKSIWKPAKIPGIGGTVLVSFVF
jgi:hypothetical protein